MSAIQQIFRNMGPAYLARYGGRMPAVHKKVMRAVMECRTGVFGTAQYGCEKCGAVHELDCGCGNRHCPTCQIDKANHWLEAQESKLLPCNYFLLTFTLPPELRIVVRSNQRVAYAAMFSCSYESLKKLARDKRFIGSPRIGMLAALHTWGGQLQYHPHLHLIVPGGALAGDSRSWQPSRQDLFVHTKPLGRIFRAKFREAMDKEGLLDVIDPAVWKREWVIDSQAVGNGQTTLRYLARYVFRVAISNNRIVCWDNHSVTFKYKDKDAGKWRKMTLDTMEFMRRFLQHVLPSGFMKIRHFGFLNANCKIPLQKIRELILLIHDVVSRLLPPKRPIPVKPKIKCSQCGHGMVMLRFILPPRALSTA
jgi:hypothetical protein